MISSFINVERKMYLQRKGTVFKTVKTCCRLSVLIQSKRGGLIIMSAHL